MNDKKARVLVIITAFVLLFAGAFLFFIFDKQGMEKNKTNNYVNYDIDDYVEVTPVVFNTYADVYSSINVSKISFKNLDSSIVEDFVAKEDELINYITDYYNMINTYNNSSSSTVYSTIKAQINGTILSILYKLDFDLDKNIFSDNVRSYFITLNVDLVTNRLLSNNDLLFKYNYSKSHIADKLFNDDVLVEKDQVVIEKETNISINRNDIERKKAKYVDRIITEFDNIIEMYIENSSLVLVYNNEDLKNIFFDNKFDVNIKFKYLN